MPHRITIAAPAALRDDALALSLQNEDGGDGTPYFAFDLEQSARTTDVTFDETGEVVSTGPATHYVASGFAPHYVISRFLADSRFLTNDTEPSAPQVLRDWGLYPVMEA